MARKSGQGRVSNRKSFLAKSEGKKGSLTSVRRGNNLYLGYKTESYWYYTKLSRNIGSVDKDNILANKLPATKGELSIFGDSNNIFLVMLFLFLAIYCICVYYTILNKNFISICNWRAIFYSI